MEELESVVIPLNDFVIPPAPSLAQLNKTAATPEEEVVPPPPPSLSQLAAPVVKPPEVGLDELLLEPGRNTRPERIVLIMRGPPGSGKSHVAKMIKVTRPVLTDFDVSALSINNINEIRH
jgi:YLP motif-containing protein 1